LEINCEIAPELPERLIGDVGRLRQVLINLTGNAIKFTEQGEVFVRAELLTATPSRCQVRFVVTDTGIGIPVEKQRLIFEAFSQADGSMSRRFGGTGLGLTISSQLVGLMGGRLEVESAPGKGSTFQFTVDLGKSAGAGDQTKRPAGPSLSGLKVLVIDDNATNRRILDGMLRRWGADPLLVADGPAALEALQTSLDAGDPFSLLLVDAMMPDMDGFSLIEQVRNLASSERPTVMMLSSADMLGSAERCRELGIASYLVKPIKSDDLLAAINAALRRTTSAPMLPASRSSPGSESANAAVANQVPSATRVLLAEDNPVNQRVACRILTKRGYPVTVVGNGKEALAALARDPFDIVLMDVQMPEMDGFEATRAIRLEEAGNGQHLPIVAMTAHAMNGDREKCLANGMDDYVTKPIEPAQLFDAIARNARVRDTSATVSNAGERNGCLNSRMSASQSCSVERAAETSPPIDLSALLERLEGDADFMHEILELFLSSSPELLVAISAAVGDGDCHRIERSAHSLKGAARNIGATPLAGLAEQLEFTGRGQEKDGVAMLFASLEAEYGRVRGVIEAVVAPAPASCHE
jgi:CheY-like chemotaxis protein